MNQDTAEKLLEINRVGYDRIAEQFSLTRKYPWREFESLKEYVHPNSKILDIGCGNGRLLSTLGDSGIDYTGLDFSDHLIRLAREIYPQHKFTVGNIITLPFSDHDFNTIFCIAVLHHIPSEALRSKAIGEIKRVIKPGGYLILSNWNLRQKHWWPLLMKHNFSKITGQSQLDWNDVLKPWKNSRGEKMMDRYIHAFTRRELKKLLNDGGFKILNQYYTKKGAPSGWWDGYNLITIAQAN